MSEPIQGVIVPTITFFEEGGKVDPFANEVLIRHILENGADVLFLMGSTGEGLYFNKVESQKKAKYLREVQKVLGNIEDKKQIVIGVYGKKPKHVIKDIENCSKEISDAGFVIPPPKDRKLDTMEQIEFFGKIIENKQGKEIYLYNNPNSFGGTEISEKALEELKKYNNLKGIKDSSGTLEQKKMYLSFLSEDFSVSCGKEGMMGEFLKIIPEEKREMAGLVPSISNLINVPKKIFKLGKAARDEEMLKLQEELNSFRNNIYDATEPKGKAQRGVKIALKYLYGEQWEDLYENFHGEAKKGPNPITLFISPSLQRTVEKETKQNMFNTIDYIRKKGYINTIKRD